MINLNDYRRIAKPIIKEWCDSKPETPPHKHVSALAQYIPCQCIAICYYMIELYGESKEMSNLLTILQKVYFQEVTGFLDEGEEE